MSNQMSDRRVEKVAELLNVLAHPVRMQIVLGLTKPAPVSDLQKRLQTGQIALVHHLTQMQDSGLLRSRLQDGDIYYSLTDIALSRAVALLLARTKIA